MSQLASQPSLVANRTLSLPPTRSPGLTVEEQETARLIIDTARTRSLVGRQTPGLVGQQAARTGQLLNPTPPQQGVPTAPNPLQQALDELEVRRNAPSLLQQFSNSGQRITGGFAELNELQRRSQFEMESRNSPASIIRRASLRQQILDQQQAEVAAERTFEFRTRRDERSEVSSLLTLAREQRFSDQAETRARQGIIERSTSQVLTHGGTRKSFGDFIDRYSELRENVAAGALSRDAAIGISMGSSAKGDVREDLFIIFSDIADDIDRDPSIADDIKVELSTPPKKTAADRDKQAFQGFLATLETGTGDEILESLAEASSLQAQMILAIEQKKPELAAAANRISLRIAKVPGSPGASTTETLAERRARAERERQAR